MVEMSERSSEKVTCADSYINRNRWVGVRMWKVKKEGGTILTLGR